jgi:hypothetical protein
MTDEAHARTCAFRRVEATLWRENLTDAQLMKPHAPPYVATLFAGLMSLTLMACASNEAKETAAATKPATAAEAAEQRKDKELSAAALGNKIMKREGEALICKRTTPTGSYIMKNTKCKTAKEWEQVYENDQKTIDEMRRVPPAPPPPTS